MNRTYIHTHTLMSSKHGVSMELPDTTGRNASPKSLVNAKYRKALLLMDCLVVVRSEFDK